MRRLLPILAVALALPTAIPLGAVARARVDAVPTPRVGHVWTIVLENSEYFETFVLGRKDAPYLTQTLPTRGKMLVNYYGTGHSSLDNYVAMVSGQGPNPSTQDDCDVATTLGEPGHKWHFDADGQAVDDSGSKPIGCTYPAGVTSLSDQLDGVGKTWRAYMENMDAQAGTRPYCANPFATGPATPPRHEDNPNYRNKHNPWAYLHATFNRTAYCEKHVVPLGYFTSPMTMTGQLFEDLKQVSTTPNYSFLTPDQCHDGHDACNGNSQLGGADRFLKAVVPAIEASPAYKKDGLIVILFDEGSTDRVCCGEKKAPNLGPNQNNGFPIPGPIGDGGGQTGAILLSPFVPPATRDRINAFNHYSYLRSMEDLFSVTMGGSDGHGHLGYAGQRGLVTFQQAGDLP